MMEKTEQETKKDVAVKLHFTFIFLLPSTDDYDIWLNRLKTIILFHCLILKSLNIHDLVVYSFFI